MGDFPMMTRKGTFIINGTERVVVSQLVRSPGVYFDRTPGQDLRRGRLLRSRSSRAAAPGSSSTSTSAPPSASASTASAASRSPCCSRRWAGRSDRIREHFALVRDAAGHPGEGPHRRPATRRCSTSTASCARASRRRKESAQALLENLFFNPKRYDLAKVGRYKANKKLERRRADITTGTLTEDDIVRTIEYLVRLHAGEDGYEVDDIDHFGNRRLRTVGELIQNQIRVGLSRMERVVRERMTTQDVEAITPQTLINIRPVVASIKEFFGTSQLSQFMDQTNPLAGLTHKRRLSALGPGGLSRDRAGMEVRDVHPSPLRPDVPDRDPGRPEHRPDRLAGLLRPGQRVRLRRDAVPQGRRRPGHRRDRLPDRRRGGPARHRPGQRA